MRPWWRSRRRRELEHEIASEVLPEAHPEEAAKAVREGLEEQRIVVERQSFVDDLSGALARHYNENNFSRIIEEAMRRKSS